MQHTIRAKKHLGQHFLNDENIAYKIVEALLEKDNASSLVEIGPGTGILTQHLVTQHPNFTAMDVDAESVELLKSKYPGHQQKFLLQDFLEADLITLLGEKFNVIGNFPYNISSQIMFKILEHKNNVGVAVGMFQKEVAERMAEKPGTKTYGILSVLLQAYFDIEYLFTVHENVFTPPPKVKSAVIRLTRNDRKNLSCSDAIFLKVVKTTFNQRRKMIRNSIQPLIANKEITHRFFEKRPEQLSVSQFEELCVFVEPFIISK
jgi:16S rRNA (adenine1518-N6/adenine1519-N6)-dimethyltransferase